jgi:hypothetical protein
MDARCSTQEGIVCSPALSLGAGVRGGDASFLARVASRKRLSSFWPFIDAVTLGR